MQTLAMPAVQHRCSCPMVKVWFSGALLVLGFTQTGRNSIWIKSRQGVSSKRYSASTSGHTNPIRQSYSSMPERHSAKKNGVDLWKHLLERAPALWEYKFRTGRIRRSEEHTS